MKTILRIIFFILLLLYVLHSAAQDIHFSQFYEMPLLRNPALAGIFKGDFRLTAAYRNQWQSVTVPYRTFGLGAEYKRSMGSSSDDFITIGLQATNDVAGDSRLSRSQVFPVLNYHKSVGGEGGGYLSAGIMGGVVFQRFDPSKLSFDDQFVNGAYSSSNPTHQVFTNTNMHYWDASAGISFSTFIRENTPVYLGVGLFHITQPKVAFQQQYDVTLNRKWMVNAGLSAPLSEQDKLVLYADYFMQGGSRQGQGGLILRHDFTGLLDGQTGISGGVFYRFRDALVPMVKLDVYHIGVGLSYDLNVSKLKTASEYRGGFELTLSYIAYRDNPNSASNKVKCPAFY